ncbi:hypothetical protein P154DRAFT_573602 [Amniculicola lignicola CBS 123094]|uniref:Uncharacterized protein n=1 Tax=Amniculicola lignicola CBS 123094 TaxID=1392246 RepID=A0A6A5WRG7_9PLEO|nr:hypothetical protein P154DRAFT_573602 [Amniculicola lignicola CBS 123094]
MDICAAIASQPFELRVQATLGRCMETSKPRGGSDRGRPITAAFGSRSRSSCREPANLDGPTAARRVEPCPRTLDAGGLAAGLPFAHPLAAGDVGGNLIARRDGGRQRRRPAASSQQPATSNQHDVQRAAARAARCTTADAHALRLRRGRPRRRAAPVETQAIDAVGRAANSISCVLRCPYQYPYPSSVAMALGRSG